MIIRREFLDGIASGTITRAFRRWQRPTVRAGGTLTTVIGVLAIEAVDAIDERTLTDADASRAGYPSLAALRRELSLRDAGQVYRIALRLAGPDPRIALREQAFDDDERQRVRAKLAAMDRAGAWTMATLALIRAKPGERAATLAASLGMEVLPFKQRVRRLKALGLTESLEIGYRLSPRGIDLLEC